MVPVTVSTVLRGKERKVITITPDASVYDAIALMAENSIGALVVVSNSTLVGILSERDYAGRSCCSRDRRRRRSSPTS